LSAKRPWGADLARETDSFRVGLIGYGYWGPKLARCLAPDCAIRTICDLSAERLAAAACDHPGAMLEQDWRKVMADPAIDAIVIATPAASHAELARAALGAGKHVLVEKPMALTGGDAIAMVEEARRRGLVLLVDHTYVHSPAIQAVREILQQGSLGRIREYRSLRYNAEGSRHDIDVLWDLAAHDLSILEHLFPGGAQAIRAGEVDGPADGPLSRAALSVHFPGPLIARIHVDWAAGEKRRRIEIAGTKGGLVFDDLQPVKLLRVAAAGCAGSGEQRPVAIATSEPLAMMARHFAACMRGQADPLTGGRAALRVVRMLEAASASLAGGGSLVALGSEDRPLAAATR
jgi:predicted dehydrogenase